MQVRGACNNSVLPQYGDRLNCSSSFRKPAGLISGHSRKSAVWFSLSEVVF
jgi:hypothetical protein